MSNRTSWLILIGSVAAFGLGGIVAVVLTRFWPLALLGFLAGYIVAYAVVQWHDLRRWSDALSRGERPWE
jgi:hypothetical protein